MKISVFEFSDYKLFLKEVVNDQDAPKGIVSKLAKAAGCQQSYLSQVLGLNAQLTPDHAYGISEYLNLSPDESEYFLCLVDYARASSLKLRQKIQKNIDKLRTQSLDISKKLNRENSELQQFQTLYYSSWIWSALHIAVSISAFSTTEALAKELNLPTRKVVSYLETLEKMGLVARKNGLWLHSGTETHVPKNSPLVSLHHNNWRQKAILSSQTGESNNTHFTGIYSISQSDYKKIQSMILEYLSSINKVASPSTCETAVCLNIDFFKITS